MSSGSDQPAAKKLRLIAAAPPPTKRKYSIYEKVLVKHLHKSLSEYLFEIKTSTYHRTTSQWRYTLSNEEFMCKQQTWTVPEDDIVKPEYEIGAVYRLWTVSGEMVQGMIKGVRLVGEKIQYETLMMANPRSYSAEEMANLFQPQV